MYDQKRRARLNAIVRFAKRMARDSAGNALPLMAAALIPLLALVGAGVDIGRSYLAQTRLQQACDSGALAARKKLGATVATPGALPSDVNTVGNKFFNQNFRNGAYDTANRSFTLSLGSDYAINGSAHIDVPTMIFAMFGKDVIKVDVVCQVKLNFSNTDIMFVLDTTGSMLDFNPGDIQNKIKSLKNVVHDFHEQMEATKSSGTRIRYGFVPYANNVNVGLLLKSDWLVDSWNYNGRMAQATGKVTTFTYNDTTWTYVSGSVTPITAYASNTCPASTYTSGPYGEVVNNIDGSGAGVQIENGELYNCTSLGGDVGYTVSGNSYDNYINRYTRGATKTAAKPDYDWLYKPYKQDLAFLKGASGNDPPKLTYTKVKMLGDPDFPTYLYAWFRGCIEERDTYEINDYNNIDLSKALDLDIDLIPTKGQQKTQWRPMLNEISYEPEILWDGTGSFNSPVSTKNDYMMAFWAGRSTCPAEARKLAEMNSSQLDDYLDTLSAAGTTYHDIGMIWGGRLLSPTGLFAAENADVPGKATSRHMIFLTDGLTNPRDTDYDTYGIEPLDKRRWNPASPALGLTLTDVIEKRFTAACAQVKKRNITVWVIGFGITLNPVLSDCAGADHSFEAKNADELAAVFSKIASQMGDLRVAQ